MTQKMAYCGLICETCPIYLVTREENKEVKDRRRAKIAQFSRKHYGLDFKLEEINDCDGCLSISGRLFSACKDCPIRNCARERDLENCAYCADYSCNKLEAFFKSDLSARRRLEELRKNII